MLILLTLLFAAFIQTSAGFGLALVSMPLLTAQIGVQNAAPLVAVVTLLPEFSILLRHRQALDLRAVGLFAAAAVPGIPLGILFLSRFEPDWVTRLLGVLLIAYALYALLAPRLPTLRHPVWAIGLGFLGGLLNGAYNTGGPPIIIYGTCRRWETTQFKSNLQAYFLVTSLLTLAAHLFGGTLTPAVQAHLPAALLGAGLGLLLGFAVERHIPAARFRQAVFILLLILGLRLLLA